MRRWRLIARRVIGGGLLVAAGWTAVAADAVRAAAHVRVAAVAVASCIPKDGSAVAMTGRVDAYAEQTGIDPDSGGTLTTFYACLRRTGRPVTIGQSAASGGEYPGNVEMEDLRISGVFVADESADGFASLAACGKYDATSGCNGLVKYWVEIADVAKRRAVKVPVPGDVTSLAVSPAGAAAWVVSTPAASSAGSSRAALYAAVVHAGRRGVLSAKAELIDRGQSINSVSFSGSSLRWRNTGNPKNHTIS
jgi:hypothetical protein